MALGHSQRPSKPTWGCLEDLQWGRVLQEGQSSAVLPAATLQLPWAWQDPVSLVPPRFPAAHPRCSTLSPVSLHPLGCPPWSSEASHPSKASLTSTSFRTFQSVFGEHSFIANYLLLKRISNTGNKGPRGGVFLNYNNIRFFICGQRVSRLEATSPLPPLITSWSVGTSSITSGQWA